MAEVSRSRRHSAMRTSRLILILSIPNACMSFATRPLYGLREPKQGRPLSFLMRSLHSFPPSLSEVSPENSDKISSQLRERLTFLPYVSPLFQSVEAWLEFEAKVSKDGGDIIWEQVKLEATAALKTEPEAGPQLYQNVLSQPCFLEAIATVIAHEIDTELIPATAIRSLIMDNISDEDSWKITQDVQAAALRSTSVGNVLSAMLFHTGFHALVCHRVMHALWQAGRTGLAKYMQSTVSSRYSADIHPAAQLGPGIYMCSSAGVVIGETVKCGSDVSILQGCTLGGTGKESGDRHPKLGNGVILQDGATVLGNIKVEDGSLVTAKSIVTKPVPPLAVVSGVPARFQRYRALDVDSMLNDDLERHLVFKYLGDWQKVLAELNLDENGQAPEI